MLEEPAIKPAQPVGPILLKARKSGSTTVGDYLFNIILIVFHRGDVADNHVISERVIGLHAQHGMQVDNICPQSWIRDLNALTFCEIVEMALPPTRL